MQQGSSSESVEDTLDDLLREAAASDAAAEATKPSRAEEREIIAAGEALAFEKGVDPKTGKVVTSLTTKWDAFVAAHGEEYGFDAAKGPTPEFTQKFSSYVFNRDSTSAVGHTGMGDWYVLPVTTWPLEYSEYVEYVFTVFHVFHVLMRYTCSFVIRGLVQPWVDQSPL